MSDRPIQVGDLVVVVRKIDCQICRATPSKAIGFIFRVGKLTNDGSRVDGHFHPGLVAFPAGESHLRYGVYRLKRIPPLSELEGVQTAEPAKEEV